MISKRLSRLLRKHFAIAEGEAALALMQQHAASDAAMPPEARAVLSSFPNFLGSIDEGYREFDDRLKIAVRNLDISSEELNASNLALERLNITTNAMMESLGQALLYFDAEGLCSPVFSKASLTLLEVNPSGRHIADVLRLDEAARADFVPLISLMFDTDSTALSFDDLIALAPKFYMHSQGLQIALSYRAMQAPSGALMGVLLVATDITQKMLAQEKLKQKEEQVLRTLRIAGNRPSFVHALRSFQAVFTTMGNAESLSDIRRDLHTIKGMANVFYLFDMAKMLHEIEDRLRGLPEKNWQPDFAGLCAEYRIRLDLGLDYARWLGREIWGMEFESGDDIISVPTSQLARFAEELRGMTSSGKTPDEIEHAFFERVGSQTVYDLLGFFETQLSYFAETAGRQIRIIHDKGDAVRLFPDFYRAFFDSLTHVARNIMDHAYEPAPLRTILGKPPELQVHIRTAYVDGDRSRFRLVISDDGQGISFDKVTKRLRQKNRQGALEGRSEHEIIQHIFDEDFSTREGTDMYSGRGIGMNVIKTEVERLGGTLRVDSEERVGTVLTATLPVLWRRPPP